MTTIDRPGSPDPVSLPFTPGMADDRGELAAMPDEIVSAQASRLSSLLVVGRCFQAAGNPSPTPSPKYVEAHGMRKDAPR